MEIITNSATETQKFGQEVGTSLKGGEVLALVGDLGSGKTTFMQGLAKALSISSSVTSPTFILMRTYKSDLTIYHLDLYRLEENIDDELKNLGVTDIWGQKDNIVVIEWAEKARTTLPDSTKWITFEYLEGDSRKITIKE